MSFDRLAAHYQWMETLAFGGALQRARLAHLSSIPEPHRALIIGEGDGRFLVELLRQFPRVEVDCIDASTRMLALAQARVHRAETNAAERVRFWQADLDEWEPTTSGAYDLVVTHFVLDCFNADALAILIPKLSRAAATDAIWLLADFRYPPRGWNRLPARFAIAAMYRFFRLTVGVAADQLIEPSAMLAAHGFSCAARLTTRRGMITSAKFTRSSAAPAQPE